jgi:predicted RNase H-like nuclease
LLKAPRRVAYKVSRSRRYWPDETPAGRRERLLEAWHTILAALQQRIEVPLELPSSFASFSEMKRYEDALDAILCAWVAIEFLKGNAEALGDEQAAIWTPLLDGEARR